MKKGPIKKILIWTGEYIWIEEREDRYIPYESHFKASMGIASPSFMHLYTQDKLAQAFQTGFLST